MSAPVLAFAEVSGGYGGSIVVRGVSGAVGPGQALCIVGRNGVGKTTLMQLLYGYLPLAAGTVRLGDADIGRLKPAARRAYGISYAPQEHIVFDDLTVRENLALMQTRPDMDAYTAYFDRFPRLGERLSQHAGTLSGGERKLLSFTRALAEQTPLVLLDEPTEGVQQENVDHQATMVADRKAAGTAFIIVEQNLRFVDAVADHTIVLDQGRVVLAGDRASLTRDAIVRHLSV